MHSLITKKPKSLQGFLADQKRRKSKGEKTKEKEKPPTNKRGNILSTEYLASS